MATVRIGWKFNEAASGTGPTAALNFGVDASADLTITYGNGSYTTNNGGRALKLSTNGSGIVENASIGSGFKTATQGTKQLTLEYQISVGSIDSTKTVGFCWVGAAGQFGIDARGNGGFGSPHHRAYWSTNLDGANVEPAPGITDAPWTTGDHVFAWVWDTTASNRLSWYIDGFLVGTTNTSITANATIDYGAGNIDAVVLEDPNSTTDMSMGYLAWTASAASAADVLAHAVRLFANNDNDPNAAGVQLRQAGTNGGTNDASTSTSDHTVAPTQTVAASGNHRALFLLITGQGVTAGVSGTPTFNGTNGTKITNTLSGTNDAEIWWWNDAALPSSAGTYSASATVDGASGTAAATLHYLEGVSQSAPTNFGSATGTGTSITATLTSSASTGSMVLGALLDATTTDTAVDAANQLPISSVNGTGTGNTHKHATSAKYIPSAGSTSMSWTGLTNTSAKIGLAIEVMPTATGVVYSTQAGNLLFPFLD